MAVDNARLIERVRRAHALLFADFDGEVTKAGNMKGGHFINTDELTDEERDHIIRALLAHGQCGKNR